MTFPAISCIIHLAACKSGRMSRGGAVWQLVGLITRRSGVQVPPPQPFGSIAQLARAFGSYPECHRFESYLSHREVRKDFFFCRFRLLFCRLSLTTPLLSYILIPVAQVLGEWCNGNTWVSKTFVEGSNPSSPACTGNPGSICFRDFSVPFTSRCSSVNKIHHR